MSFSQLANLVGLLCLIAALILSRRYWGSHRWLFHVYGGLLLAAAAGCAISFSASAFTARLLSLPMLVGICFVVWKPPHQKGSRAERGKFL